MATSLNPYKSLGYDGSPDLRAKTWKEAFIRIVESVLEDAARKNAVFDTSYDELRAAVLKHAYALDDITTPCLVHWDAWDPNFFVKDGKIVGIITAITIPMSFLTSPDNLWARLWSG